MSNINQHGPATTGGRSAASVAVRLSPTLGTKEAIMTSKLLSAIALLFVFSSAIAKEEPPLQQMLSAAEMAGVCILLDAQIGFQAKAKIEGGWAFIQQFWDAEAARVGKTREQYLKDCSASMKAYANIQRMLSDQSKN